MVATKPFKAGDLILMCKGGVKDLTKSEDEALREEAAVDRERKKEEVYGGVLGQGRDFSVIRSARKGCSQLLLGPARFVNHDCDPNCEFHRLGQSQMVFKCLRDIGLNEEITTYYGDNYFEWENSECMCKTCEDRGKGFFSSEVPIKSEEILSKSEVERQRRTSQRKVPNRSPPPARTSPTPTTATFDRNGKALTKTFNHHVSQREFDANSTTHRGPKCMCLTCGTSFWAPETWWMPDECRRCERHYRIFKADWPGRLPTEGGWSARANLKRKELERTDVETKKRKLLHAPSPGVSSNSEADTPVKLSPLRDLETIEQPAKRPKSRVKKRKIDTDDGTDEDAIDAALQRASPSRLEVKLKKGGADDRMEEESDLTSVSDEGDGEDDPPLSMGPITPSSADSDVSSTSSKPSGPKMLGKSAKTETLALYWGAPLGDRRKRRQSHNGLENLDTIVKPSKKDGSRSVSLRNEHRRTASDASIASAPSKTNSIRIQSSHENANDHRRGDFFPDVGSPAKASEEITWQSPQSVASVPTVTSSNLQDTTGNVSPIQNVPGLATKGPERTSVKNLAMAWSAGVEEGGRGSRRRQSRGFSQSSSIAISPTTSKKRIVSREEPAVNVSLNEDRSMDIKPESSTVGPLAEVTRPALQGMASPPVPILQTTGRPVSPAVTVEEAPVRHVAPLLGPPVSFASRPGIIPGKPIRKNLRWGSGKVSSSRPFVGPSAPLPGSTFPIGATSISESSVPRLNSQDHAFSRAASQGALSNGGHEEGTPKREATSPLVTKDRLSSPLARAALHASALSSTQLQSITNGSTNSGHNLNGNGVGHVIKQRPTSPTSLMGPPRSLHRSSNSPGIQSPQSIQSPAYVVEKELADTDQVQEHLLLNGKDDSSLYSIPTEKLQNQ